MINNSRYPKTNDKLLQKRNRTEGPVSHYESKEDAKPRTDKQNKK